MTYPPSELQTARRRLRTWRVEDLPLFAELNADQGVTEHLLGSLTRAQGDALVEQVNEHFHLEGFGFWAVDAPGVASFVGMVGMSVPRYTAPFTPCVEVRWRIAQRYWDRGFATEEAEAALEFGFTTLDLQEIVALTVPANARSWAVMSKLGMTSYSVGRLQPSSCPAWPCAGKARSISAAEGLESESWSFYSLRRRLGKRQNAAISRLSPQ
jgi:RimJ/RimL family protein N-acetyltransferase